MGDIALSWSLDAGAADISLESDDIATDEGLRTAVLISLFCDRRAEDTDVLPGDDGDQRGWWGDEFAEVEGDRVGSRLWLLDRAKRTTDVATQAEAYAREALAWMIEDLVASAVDVAVTATGHVLSMVVTITRPTGDRASFRFAHTWEAEEELAI